MIKKLLLILLITWLGASAALAVMPTREELKKIDTYRQRDHCKASPTIPEWARDDNARFYIYDTLAIRIYRVLANETVIKMGICSCDTKYPSWDEAKFIFNRDYENADIGILLAADHIWAKRSRNNRISSKTRKLCRDQNLRGRE
ncbi:MAG: hypothetical protein HRU28_05040 [Rhizobiales bacterium]|nr:hypothetical protein [Hyphomicrobiales bacterium]